jgi:putative SbcD/Mre11-related phosphoesterase
MDLKFITNEPALTIGKALVVADLHIGIEFQFFKSGIKVPSQTEQMKARIDRLLDQTGAEKLVVLGDVKHEVPGVSKQELREIPEFLEHFAKKIEVEVLPGNHDSSIKDFLPENVKLRPSDGIKIGDFYLLHGHSWPDKDFLNAKYVISGHEHPQLEFRDKMGYRFWESVWVHSQLNKSRIMAKYKSKTKKIPKMIIMPRFNEFSGGIAINRPFKEKNYEYGLGPLMRSAELGNAKIYMLDGTFLGKLRDLR